MENLKIKYNDALPEIDFSVFYNSSDSCGIEIKRIIEGMKGNDFEEAGRLMCYEVMWNYAMNFVSPQLKNWNGWTQAWYVEEFLKRCGFEYITIRGQKIICYNGKPL